MSLTYFSEIDDSPHPHIMRSDRCSPGERKAPKFARSTRDVQEYFGRH